MLFEEGGIILNYVRMVKFAQVLYFFQRLKLALVILFVKTDLFHHTAVYLSVFNSCYEIDCTE